MSKEIVIVSTAWCANCAVLKDQLTRNNIVYNVIDGDTDEGMAFCREHNVRSLPTSFIYEGDEIVKTIVGVGKLEDYV